MARSCDSDDLVEVLGVKARNYENARSRATCSKDTASPCKGGVCEYTGSKGTGYLFRSVSHQVYGDDKHHGLARRSVADYMSLERPFFQSFVEGDSGTLDRYISEKRRAASWGGEPRSRLYAVSRSALRGLGL